MNLENDTPSPAMKPYLPFALALLLLLTACGTTPMGTSVSPEVSPPPREPTPTLSGGPVSTDSPPPKVTEVPITRLPLEGPAALRSAEYSGMTWYGETLVLLPQYPDRFAAQAEGADGALFVLSQEEILNALETASPLEPRALPLWWGDLPKQISGFEGFEAIAFDGETAYLTIEASPAGGMKGYLVRGLLTPDLSALRIDIDSLTEIPLPADLPNRSDESLLWTPQGVAAFYEVNGAHLNPAPAAQVFSSQMMPVVQVPFPRLEYRLTDVSTLDGQGVFWGINYFYPGDVEQRTSDDPLAVQYGLGETHAQSEVVERLVAFRWGERGVTLLPQAPVYLQLAADGEARNWEGLVRLPGRGFLLVTDKYPETLLGFVPWP